VSTCERLYNICTANWTSSTPPKQDAKPNTHLASFYRKWIVTEAARYCVSHRLRTHLGNAFQTFESLEKLLQDRHDNPLFLEFIDRLEREMTHATEGTSQYSITTVQFFETNKKVCQDWFSRFRSLIARVSEDATHVRNASIRIQDLRVMLLKAANETTDWSQVEKFVMDYERIIIRMCEILVDMKDCDALQGLLKWTESVFSFVSMRIEQSIPRLDAIMTVIRGLRLECDGEWENAITCYQTAFQSVQNLDHEVTVPVIIDRIVICYCQLNDWSGLDEWNSFLNKVKSQTSNDRFLAILNPSSRADTILEISQTMRSFNIEKPSSIMEPLRSHYHQYHRSLLR
jgi:PI-3-kinase-related kinase SMG-1